MYVLDLLAYPAGSLLRVFVVNAILMIVGLYALIGLLVGLAFALRGVGRVDPAARDSPFVFRLVILPGCVGLWPFILLKWMKVGKERPG